VAVRPRRGRHEGRPRRDRRRRARACAARARAGAARRSCSPSSRRSAPATARSACVLAGHPPTPRSSPSRRRRDLERAGRRAVVPVRVPGAPRHAGAATTAPTRSRRRAA
jgi:hypothetical protein